MIEIIQGDLLEAPEQYILHQTNCLSNGDASGLAYYLFKKFPYADCYSDRQEPSVPGTIDIRGNGLDQRYVINLHGQYYPGNIRYPLSIQDGIEARQKYFYKGLNKIAKIENLQSIAIPFRVSCGIAGGDWEGYYLGVLNNFADYVFKKQGTKVVIYQRKEDA